MLLCILVGYSNRSYVNLINYRNIVDSSHKTINMTIILLFFLCVSACRCERQYRVSQYISSFVTFHVRFYDWFHEEKNIFIFHHCVSLISTKKSQSFLTLSSTHVQSNKLLPIFHSLVDIGVQLFLLFRRKVNVLCPIGKHSCRRLYSYSSVDRG